MKCLNLGRFAPILSSLSQHKWGKLIRSDSKIHLLNQWTIFIEKRKLKIIKCVVFVLVPVKRMYQLKASTNISEVQTLRGELTQKKRESGDVMKWNQTQMKSLSGSTAPIPSCVKNNVLRTETRTLCFYMQKTKHQASEAGCCSCHSSWFPAWGSN